MASPTKILICAIFPPGAAGGDWVIIQHLLRGVDWKRLSWWSLFGSQSHLAKTLGDRLHLFNAAHRLAPAKKWKRFRGLLFEHIVVPLAACHLRKTIQKEKPDRLWVVSYGWAIPVFSRVIPKLGIPYHFSMHDMPDTAPMVEMLGVNRAQRFQLMQDQLYSGAMSRNVVWRSMGEIMQQRTGIAAEYEFRCSIEPENLERLKLPPPEKDISEIRIGYAGTILAEDSFAFLVQALKEIRKSSPIPICIHLFSSHTYHDRPWFDPEIVIERGHMTFQELQKPYAECHWGLALMQSDDRDPQYNRYSFPCKFTQSLAAGLPILSIGHSTSTLLQLATQYDLGCCISEKDIDKATEILQSKLISPPQTQHYRTEAYQCAHEYFNADQMRGCAQSFLN